MAKSIVGTCIGAMGIAAGMASPLAAQTLWLPGSDPVNIGRSGTGVAFGQSLEAAALNPALLSSIRDPFSAYLAAGGEFQCTSTGSSSTEHTLFSTDRNRFLPGFGSAWRVSDNFTLGLKLDNPFMRHATIPQESNSRFTGSAISLSVRRVEVQGAWALSPNVSVGLGLGIARVDYDSSASMRVPLPANPSQPLSAGNPSQGLMELPTYQMSSSNASTFSVGLRWAINPRWTLAAAYQSAIKVTPTMTAQGDKIPATYYDNDGYSTPNLGTADLGPALYANSQLKGGTGSINLPGRASFGVRQRVNQIITWETDIQFIQGKDFELPTEPSLVTPSGTYSCPPNPRKGRNGWGISSMMELTLTKRWTARIGAELMPALIQDAYAEPLVGGAPSSGFSAGVSLKALKGEFSFGYQYRQSRTRLSPELDGAWDLANGYRTTGTPIRVESSGHLLSIGYKKVF